MTSYTSSNTTTQKMVASLLFLAGLGILAFSCFATRTFVQDALSSSPSSAPVADAMSWISVLFTVGCAGVSLLWGVHKNLAWAIFALVLTGVFNAGYGYSVFFGDGGQTTRATGEMAAANRMIAVLEDRREPVQAMMAAELQDGLGPNTRKWADQLQEIDSQLASYQAQAASAEASLADADAGASLIASTIRATIPAERQILAMLAFLLVFCIALDPFVYFIWGVSRRAWSSANEVDPELVKAIAAHLETPSSLTKRAKTKKGTRGTWVKNLR